MHHANQQDPNASSQYDVSAATNTRVAGDTGLACTVLLARFLQVAAEPEQIRHRFGLPGRFFSNTEILRALKSLDLKAKTSRSRWSRLPLLALPAIAKDRSGQYFILARADEEKVLVQSPSETAPRVVQREEFESEWSGELILVTKRSGSVSPGKFGFAWFIPAIIRYRKILGEVLVASFFLQLFALVTPLFFQVVVDKVLVHKGMTTLDVLALGLLCVSIFEVALGGLRTYLFSHTTNRIDVELGARLYNHLISLPLAYFQSRRVGDSVARVRELENVRNFVTGSALTVLIDAFFTVVFLAVMFYYSPLLALIVVGSIPLYVLLSFVVIPILRRRLDEKFARGAENQAFLVESVSGVETLKSMAVEPQMQRRWEDQLAAYVSASFRAANLGNIASQAASFINKLVTLAILWFGARLVIEGELSVGQLVAFNMLAGRVSGPVLRLVQLWQDFQQAGISVERLGDILNAPTEQKAGGGRSMLPRINGRVTFEHVNFRYRADGPEILSDFSLDVPEGQVIGIVGRSGSGKSTTAKLVQRLYVPERGRVMVDGVDLSMVDPAWLRRQIGVVLQENILFNRTVRENIALADPGMPMERVVHVAKLAGAHEFIVEMAEGYDTVLGEHGNNISGGQRQRIAIARALATDPRILIFDEATSALDAESERIIQQNHQAIAKGRTVFIIAHRLSTLRHADRIIVIDKGRIVEEGTHDELLKQGETYARLYAHQTGAYAVR